MARQDDILESLDKRRRDLGMSMPVLARRAGLGLATVHRALRNGAGVQLSSLRAVAAALGVSIGLVRPRRLSAVRREQAREKASVLVSAALGSAAIEHAIADEATTRQIEGEAREALLNGSNLALWA